MDNPLPQNIGSEAELLGNLIKNNDGIMEAIQIISPEDFYVHKHQKIFGAMVSLFKKNIEIDIITLSTELKPYSAETGGVSYISTLYECSMGRSNKAHLDNIKNCSTLRKIIIQSKNMMAQAMNDKDPRNIIETFTNSMLDLQTEGTRIKTLEEVMKSTLSFVKENFDRGGGIIGMPCGLERLDNVTDGFIKKDMVVIASRPSMGKTLLAMTIATGLSKNNKVAVFELEMSEEALGVRMLASKSMINGVKLKRGDIVDQEWQEVRTSASDLSTHSLWIDTNASQDIFNIKAKAKRLKVTNGLDAIIIDHIGLLEETSKNQGNRNATISEITRQSKIMAKELDICVILLSQLNRGVEQRSDKRPLMSDLRESGSVEQDADLILFLYRDEYYNLDTEDRNILEINISKQRNGKTGILRQYCDLGLQIIADLDEGKR